MGKSVSHDGNGERRIALSKDNFRDLLTNEFTVKVLKLEANSIFVVGVVTKLEEIDPNVMLGISKGTWGFNSRGEFYQGGRSRKLDYAFKEGDIINVVVNTEEGKLALRINEGTFISIPNSLSEIKKIGSLYPAVGIQWKIGTELLLV